MDKIAVVLASGGLDSSTLAYLVARDLNCAPVLLSINYGQRHVKEIACARHIAGLLSARHIELDIASVGALLSGSALTSPAVAVPDGHYAEASMKATVVPNRNAILLSLAYGVAVAQGASMVAAAVHAGDHFIYPDCRPDFIAAFEDMERHATRGFARPDLELFTPFLASTKAEIVARGAALGVPFEHTWSCYKGGDTHCGTCGTCVERKEAFALAGVTDPTVYEV